MGATEKTALLERVIKLGDPAMTPDVARWWMTIRAEDELQARFDNLADRNTEGVITPEELDEYDEYLRVSRIVSALQGKARKVLAQASGH